jgi:hypothetical protein
MSFLRTCKRTLGLDQDDLQRIIDKMYRYNMRMHMGVASLEDRAKYERKINELKDLLRSKGLWPSLNKEEECLREIHERIQNILCSLMVQSNYYTLLFEKDIKELLFPTQLPPTYPGRPYTLNPTRLVEDGIYDKQQNEIDLRYGPDSYSGDNEHFMKWQDGGKRRKTKKSRKTKRSRKNKGRKSKRRI